MTYEEFIAVVKFGHMNEMISDHEFYRLRWHEDKNDQEFFDYLAQKIPGQGSYPFAKRFGDFYFTLPSDVVIPEDFCGPLDVLDKATDKPTPSVETPPAE